MSIEYRAVVAYGFYGDEPSSDLEERIGTVLSVDPEDISQLLMEDPEKLLKDLGGYDLLGIEPILNWSSGDGWAIYVATSKLSWYPREDQSFLPLDGQISAEAQAQLEALLNQLFPEAIEDPNGWGTIGSSESQPTIGWFATTIIS